MKRSLSVLLFVFLLMISNAALAAPISFTATDFNTYGSTPAPQDTISGSFDYSLDASNFLTLNSFNMTISNKSYLLSEIFIDQPFGENTVLMGDNGAANGISHIGVDDFWFRFDFAAEEVWGLSYTTAEVDGYWSASTYETISAPSAVPEPSTWLLLGTGLAGLAYYRRKKN